MDNSFATLFTGQEYPHEVLKVQISQNRWISALKFHQIKLQRVMGI